MQRKKGDLTFLTFFIIFFGLCLLFLGLITYSILYPEHGITTPSTTTTARTLNNMNTTTMIAVQKLHIAAENQTLAVQKLNDDMKLTSLIFFFITLVLISIVLIYSLSRLSDLDENSTPTADDIEAKTNSNTPVQITLTGSSQIPEDVLKFSVVRSPQHGNFVSTYNTVTYSPKDKYIGTDSFTYVSNNVRGVSSNIATVTIEVKPASSGAGGAPADLR